MMIVDPLRSDAQKKRAARKRRRARRRAEGCSKPKTWCRVYCVTGLDGRVRYVGQTRQTLDMRLRWLRKAARSGNSPVHQWLRAEPHEIVLLDDNATWDVSEVLWIERMRARGEPLLNVLRGGRDSLGAIAREGR